MNSSGVEKGQRDGELGASDIINEICSCTDLWWATGGNIYRLFEAVRDYHTMCIYFKRRAPEVPLRVPLR